MSHRFTGFSGLCTDCYSQNHPRFTYTTTHGITYSAYGMNDMPLRHLKIIKDIKISPQCLLNTSVEKQATQRRNYRHRHRRYRRRTY